MPIDASKVKWDSPAIDASKVKWDEPTPKNQTIYNNETVYDPVTGVPILSGGGGESAKGATGTVAKALETIVSTPAAFSAGASNVMSGLGSLLPGAAGQYFKEMGQQSRGMVKGMGEATNSGLVLPAAQLAGEITATSPAGKILASGVQKVAPKATELANALRTSGMGGGSLGTRVAGGAATGAAQAGALSPEDAAIGAVLGGGVAGVVGKGVAKVAAPGVSQAVDAGYVIPPTQAGGGVISRLAEGLSGKAATAQAASVKNQNVTNSLAAKALGLPDDAPITTESLAEIRKEAGKAYDALASLPKVEPVAAQPLMNIPASKGLDPKQAVYDLRVARNDADAYYKSYGRTADPEALTKAKTAKAEATRIEKELEDYATSIGQTDLVPALRAAREQIAKTFTVEKALNPVSGTVDARELAKALRKGKPLTGELKQAAEFASQFPKAAQVMEKSGGAVALSPLDYLFAGGAGLNAFAGGGSGLDVAQNAAIGLGARNAARAAILSKPVQGRFSSQQNPNALAAALRNSLARTPALTASLADPRSD